MNIFKIMKKREAPMNAVAAFENRKDTLREQLEASENMPQAISAATMTLEQAREERLGKL